MASEIIWKLTCGRHTPFDGSPPDRDTFEHDDSVYEAEIPEGRLIRTVRQTKIPGIPGSTYAISESTVFVPKPSVVQLKVGEGRTQVGMMI